MANSINETVCFTGWWLYKKTKLANFVLDLEEQTWQVLWSESIVQEFEALNKIGNLGTPLDFGIENI